MVRFTQTKDLNDPNECLPDFKYFCDNGLKTRLALEVLQRNNQYCKSLSKRKHFVRCFRRNFNWKDEISKSYNTHLDIIGIFSISKAQFNSHLWENYAGDGFCLEFDYNSDFFSRRPTDVPSTGELYAVNYSDIPIVFDARNFFLLNIMIICNLKCFIKKRQSGFGKMKFVLFDLGVWQISKVMTAE